MKIMAHQEASLKFLANKKAVFDTSSPGTGKTLVQIIDFARQHARDGKRLLVIAPKSLLRAAWANDIKKFAPHLSVAIGSAGQRDAAIASNADVVVVNVDGAKELSKLPKSTWASFGRIVIDESSFFKHGNSIRSKSLAKLMKLFEYRRCMTGTPTSNGICDIWHQVLLLDNGERLGKSFAGFRKACCIPEQIGPLANMIKWHDRPDIELQIAAIIADITIRHKFEDCVDIPENHQYAIRFNLTNKHLSVYNDFKKKSLAEFSETTVTAINGAVLASKLLQIASGAVYGDGAYSLIANERYSLALDLVEARQHSIVFYQWKHQCDELVKEAVSRGIKYAVWDSDKHNLVEAYQAGEYQVLFAHPQSAGHGLTLTIASTTIWTSPTYNLEHFLQGLKRIHRIGQVKKTENIVLVAEGTIDETVWEAVQAKDVKMNKLFDSLKAAA